MEGRSSLRGVFQGLVTCDSQALPASFCLLPSQPSPSNPHFKCTYLTLSRISTLFLSLSRRPTTKGADPRGTCMQPRERLARPPRPQSPADPIPWLQSRLQATVGASRPYTATIPPRRGLLRPEKLHLQSSAVIYSSYLCGRLTGGHSSDTQAHSKASSAVRTTWSRWCGLDHEPASSIEGAIFKHSFGTQVLSANLGHRFRPLLSSRVFSRNSLPRVSQQPYVCTSVCTPTKMLNAS